jgi:hypothetical protein
MESKKPMNLTEAIQEALSGAGPRVLGSAPAVFVLPARNGGRGKVEVMSKGRGDQWIRSEKEYDLRFLRVSVSRNSGGVALNFGLCPFEDGGKVARVVPPMEVLEHVSTGQITEKLKLMIEQTGDLRFDPGARAAREDDI